MGIMEWVAEEYADDACVLQTIGWMDEDFDFNEEAIVSDVTSLDPVVTGPLFEGHEDLSLRSWTTLRTTSALRASPRRSKTLFWTQLRRLLRMSASFIFSRRAAWSSLSLLVRNKKTMRENLHKIFEINLTK